MKRAALKPVDHSWKVTLARRGSEKVHDSMQVVAGDLHEAMKTALEHCSSPGLDLEVTAVERLPSGVITRNARRGRAA